MIGSRPDGWSRISSFLNCWKHVQTNADWRPDGDIWIVILASCMSASWRETTSSGRLKQSSIKLNLARIWSWSITERRPDGLLRCLNGCKLEQELLDSVKVRMGIYVVRTVWHVIRTDGTVDRWAFGWDGTVVWTADREPKSSDL
jgi:hypothetical protein